MKPSTTLTTALSNIYNALEPLTPKDRRNVVNAVFVLLTDEPDTKPKPTVSAPRKATTQPPKAAPPKKVTATTAGQGPTADGKDRSDAQLVRDFINGFAGKVITRAEILKCGARETTVDVEVSRLVSLGVLTRLRRGQYRLGKVAPRAVTPAKGVAHH